MTDGPLAALPAHYRGAIRTTIRFTVVMGVVGLLVGISFQESAKKLDFASVGAGLHIEARVHLALVHGHTFLTAVVLPLVLLGALVLARRAGGRELGPRGLRWLTWGFLPGAALVLALMLYKGYHYLLCVRAGASDLAEVDAGLFGGLRALRYAVNGAAHGLLGLSLTAFLVLLWRSLGRRREKE
jgi:hypothetical protein